MIRINAEWKSIVKQFFLHPRWIVKNVLKLADFSVIDARAPRTPRYLEHVAPDDFKNEINHNGALVGLFEFVK